MSQRLQDGTWFTLLTAEQHAHTKRFGRPDAKDWLSSARVQIGTWVGPGRYLVLQYTQRCPRNCCNDSVCELIPAAEVLERVRQEMIELANVRLAARGAT